MGYCIDEAQVVMDVGIQCLVDLLQGYESLIVLLNALVHLLLQVHEVPFCIPHREDGILDQLVAEANVLKDPAQLDKVLVLVCSLECWVFAKAGLDVLVTLPILD